VRISGWKLFLFSLFCFLGVAGSDLVAEESTKVEATHKAEPSPTASADASKSVPASAHSASAEDSESEEGRENSCVSGAALEDLSKQRAAIEAREKDLAAREAELRSMEQGIGEELKKLTLAREEFVKLNDLRKKENQQKVAKIVETVESMSPKSAAALFATLDDALAVTAMEQISTPKLAKIMNLMEPGRSTRLTELLAGVVRARSAGDVSNRNLASRDVEGPAVKSVKGGEKNDGQSNSKNSGGKTR
jgi:flagellar motility protein MotE (MotC chaperone)